MKRKLLLAMVITAAAMGIACQKSVSDFAGGTGPGSITVSNLVGTYTLKSITLTYLGMTYNVYDSLRACEKDDYYKFNADMTVNYVDAGTVCVPPGDDNDTWVLRNDSLFIGSTTDGAKISKFDGTTLQLTSTPNNVSGASSVTTLVKK